MSQAKARKMRRGLKNRHLQMIALGGALFFLSDAMILGRTLFTATHAVDWVIMITYYSAQLLIGASCLV